MVTKVQTDKPKITKVKTAVKAETEKAVKPVKAETVKAETVKAVAAGKPEKTQTVKPGKTQTGGWSRSQNIESAIKLLMRPSGATIADLLGATTWAETSANIFVQSYAKRNFGLKIEKIKIEGKPTVYKVQS